QRAAAEQDDENHRGIQQGHHVTARRPVFSRSKNGRARAGRLFPLGRDDRVVVAKDQVKPVWIVRDASDAARRYDPAQYFWEILLADDALLAGLRLTMFDKLL